MIPLDKGIVASNGYAEGLKIKIITYNNPRPYNPPRKKKLAATLQAELTKAGVETEVKSYPWEQYKEALLQKKETLFLRLVSDNGAPDNFLIPCFHQPRLKAASTPPATETVK